MAPFAITRGHFVSLEHTVTMKSFNYSYTYYHRRPINRILTQAGNHRMIRNATSGRTHYPAVIFIVLVMLFSDFPSQLCSTELNKNHPEGTSHGHINSGMEEKILLVKGTIDCLSSLIQEDDEFEFEFYQLDNLWMLDTHYTKSDEITFDLKKKPDTERKRSQ